MKFKFKLISISSFNPYFAFIVTILNIILGSINDKIKDMSVY